MSSSTLSAEEMISLHHSYQIGGPFCGVYDVYTCFRLLGKHPALEEFLRPDYVTGDGSTWSQLISACEDKGLFALAERNLSVEDIAGLKWPVIVHTSSDASSHFDHFLVIAKSSSDEFTILDPPAADRKLSRDELQQVWDGTALVVSNQRLDKGDLGGQTRKSVVILVSVVGCVLCVLFLVEKYRVHYSPVTTPLLLRSMQSFFELGCISVLLGLTFSHLRPKGVYAAKMPSNTADRTLVNVDKPIAPAVIINKDQMRVLAGKPDVIILDARLPFDYGVGHIANSVNLPALCSDARRHIIMDRIILSQKLVIYCQDSGCPYSDELYRLLVEDGYKNIEIFRDGWEGWNR